MEQIEWLQSASNEEFHHWLQQRHAQFTEADIEEGKNAAEELSDDNKLAEALALLDRLFVLREVQEQPLWTALVWRGRANVFQAHERNIDSLHASDQAISIYRQYGDNFLIAIASLNKIAILSALGQWDEALTLAEWIHPHFAEKEFTLGLGQLTLAQAYIHECKWEFNLAFAEYQHAESILSKLENSEKRVAWVHLQLGVVSLRLDQLQEANTYLFAAKEVFDKLDDVFYQVKTLSVMAFAFVRLTQYEQALASLQEARDLLVPTPESPDIGFIDLDEAQVRLKLNQLDQAEVLARNALRRFESLGQKHDSIEAMIFLSQILAFSLEISKVGEAIALLDRSVRQLSQREVPILISWLQIEQAELLFNIGQTKEAEKLLNAAMAVIHLHNMPLLHAQALCILADCNKQLQPKRSQSLYESALHLLGGQRILLAVRCHRGLAYLAHMQRDWNKAEQEFTIAVAMMEELRRLLHGHSHQAGFDENRTLLVQELFGVLLQQPDSQLRIFGWLERIKASVLADLVISSPIDSELDPTVQATMLERQRLTQQLDSLLSSSFGKENGQIKLNPQRERSLGKENTHRQAEIENLRRRIQSIDEVLNRYQNTPLDRAITSDEIIEKIPSIIAEDTLLISYFTAIAEPNVGQIPSSRLFALTATHQRDNIQIFDLHVTLEEVQSKWNNTLVWIKPPATPSAISQLQKRLGVLYRQLLAPLKAQLTGKKRLIILPHRFLSQIPFAALYNSDTQNYLIKQCTIQITPSITILDYCRQLPTGSKAPLIVGYSDEPNSLNFLPSVEPEVKALHKIFPSSALLFDEDATLDTVLEKSPGSEFVHFAAHAHFELANPLEAGIALAKKRHLRASDLYRRHKFLNGSTIVTSACKSAQGVSSGSEVIGLASAFLYAGASAVLAGLWNIEDNAANELMIDFYRHWQQGLDAAEALRQAQIELFKNDKYRSPFYWAPFVLNGDSRKLNPQG